MLVCVQGRADVAAVSVYAGTAGSALVSTWVGRYGPLEIRHALFLRSADLVVYVHVSPPTLGVRLAAVRCVLLLSAACCCCPLLVGKQERRAVAM